MSLHAFLRCSRIGALVLLCLLCAAACDKAPAPTAGYPNVLLILADDLGYNDVGIYSGGQNSLTPEIDRLARQGMRFTRFYTDSTCSPSRAALLSGQYPARVGYRANGPGLSPELVTLPEHLRSLGFTTYHVGKWHIGDQRPEALPQAQGFDHWFGFTNQWLLDGTMRDGVHVQNKPTYINPWLSRDGAPAERLQGHLNDILARDAAERIAAFGGEGRPWFINLWLYAPHAPIQPDPRYAARFPDTPQGRYFALLSHLDRSVGEVLRALEATGQARNTIVIFASDNGGTNKEADNNAPFFGNKASYFEGGVRTPFLAIWPGRIRPGSVSSQITAIQDIYPTLASMMGAPLQDARDGIDVSPVFRGDSLPARTLMWEVFADGRFGYSVLSADGRWRSYNSWPWIMDRAAPVLLDLASDPSGSRNDYAVAPQTFDQLHQEYLAWHASAHRLAVDFDRTGARGAGVARGDSMQRTPGFGGFTLALALALDAGRIPQLEAPMVLAEQPGVWRIDLDRSFGVSLRIGSRVLEGKLEAGAQCQTVVFSANFDRRTTPWPEDRDRSAMLLANDESVLSELAWEGRLEDLPMTETFLGRSADGEEFPATILGHVFLNKRVNDGQPPSLLDIRQELCGAGPAPRG